MITEIIVLTSENEYDIYERMDRRKKCIWTAFEKTFNGSSGELITYLEKQGDMIISIVNRERLRVEMAPEI